MTNDEPTSIEAASDDHDPSSSTDPSHVLRSFLSRADRGSTQRRDKIESLKVEIKDLQAEIRSLDSVSGTMSLIIGCIEDERWAGALRELRGAKRLREQLLEFDTTSADSFDQVEQWLESQAQSTIAALPRTLIAELGDEIPDPESKMPRFVFRRSFLTVEINRKKFEASVATRVGKVEKIAADASTIAAHVRAELTRCFDRDVDLADFARRLRSAYEQTDAGRRGAPAGIRDVAALSDENVALDEFSVDLARLLGSSEGTLPDARGLKLDHTKDTDRGLLLPGLEERGYFGAISYNEFRSQPEDEHVGP